MKRSLCVLLALLMLLPTLSTVAVAASSSTSSVNGHNGSFAYYYRDSYFEGKASDYNASLSTMSYSLARAGFASSANNWTSQYVDLFRLFGEIGFTDCDVNEDYKRQPSTDTMGVGAAHKTVVLGGKNYTVLAVVPRSGGYEAEWASNFTVGTSGEAAGFSSGAAKVQAFLETYVAQYGKNFVGELKLWIVGYSRGAAVANLVAGHLTKAGRIGAFSFTKENVFAYTFETPRGASTEVVSLAEAQSYTNIHNVISSNDLVTKVAPAYFGFIRYGTDEYVIPETRTAQNAALFDTAVGYLPESLAAYDASGKRIFASETFQAKKFTTDLSKWASLGRWVKNDGVYTWEFVDSNVAKALVVVDSDKTMGAFLEDLVTALSVGIGTRKAYANDVQDLIRLLMSETLGSNYQTQALSTASSVLQTRLQEQKTSILAAAVTGNVAVLENILTDIITETLAASSLDAAAYAKLPAQIAAAVPILAKAAVADVVIDGGSDILTLIDNLAILFNPHEPAQCAAWLCAMDVNYTGVPQKSAAVTNVQVSVNKVTETKKVLFIKTTVTKYVVTITPVSEMEVQSVAYRTLLLGKLTNGTSFTKDLKPSYLYIEVTDANGNVSHWEYKNNKIKQVD